MLYLEEERKETLKEWRKYKELEEKLRKESTRLKKPYMKTRRRSTNKGIGKTREKTRRMEWKSRVKFPLHLSTSTHLNVQDVGVV